MLGPLLFILFINDIPMTLQDTDTDMYADNSTLTAQAKTTPELEGSSKTGSFYHFRCKRKSYKGSRK